MKKKLMIISSIALCIAIAAGGTLAYFSDKGTAHNVVTMGEIDIEVVEQQEDENGDLHPYEDPVKVLPTTEVSKIVTIQNVAEEQRTDAWIRVKLDKKFHLDREHGQGKEPNPEYMTLSINTEDWIENDGWYYYKESVAPGESTAPLFTSVAFAAEMGNEYQCSVANVDIYAQAVQTANNPAPDGDVTRVAGWPAEPKE